MRPVTWLSRLAFIIAGAALLAGCETTDPRPTSVAAAHHSPTFVLPTFMTRTRAAAECWMATEKTAQTMDLDRRADVVQGCIDKKMRGDPTA